LTDRRTETDEKLTPVISRRSRPEGISKEVKTLAWPTTRSMQVFAVYDARLFGIQAEFALCQTLLNAFSDLLQLRVGLAVHNDIIGIPLKADSGMIILHPLIKTQMQKEIGQ
jgi:hypothetical protein